MTDNSRISGPAHRRRPATYADEDYPVDTIIGSYTTGLPPEEDADGNPIPVPPKPPIGFVRFGWDGSGQKVDAKEMME